MNGVLSYLIEHRWACILLVYLIPIAILLLAAIVDFFTVGPSGVGILTASRGFFLLEATMLLSAMLMMFWLREDVPRFFMLVGQIVALPVIATAGEEGSVLRADRVRPLIWVLWVLAPLTIGTALHNSIADDDGYASSWLLQHVPRSWVTTDGGNGS